MPSDTGEVHELASQEPERFQEMLSAYEDYEKAVGVIKMPEGYFAEREVGKKSVIAMFKSAFPFLLTILFCLAVFFIWRKRRKSKA